MIDIITENPSFTTIKASSLTAGRIPIVSTAGLIADDADFLWDTSTNALGFGTATLTPVVATGENNVYLRPKGAGEGRILFKVGKGGGAITDYTGAQIRIEALSGAESIQPSPYFNSVFCAAVTDGTNMRKAYDWGTEGSWTLGGGFTLSRTYLWEYDAAGSTGRAVWWYQKQSEETALGQNCLYIGGDVSAIGASPYCDRIDLQIIHGRLLVGGRTMLDDANLKVSGGQFLATYTKNDANVRDFPVVQIKPTLNFGASNSNTTVPLLDLDTVNTSVTGVAVGNLPLIRAAYGGTVRLLFGATSGMFALYGPTDTSCQLQMRSYGGSGSTSIPNFYGSRGRGTQAVPLRTKQSDVLARFSGAGWAAVDDSTTATESGATRGRIDIFAVEDFTASAQGTYFEFYGTTIGATTSILKMHLSTTGNIKLGVVADIASRSTTDGTKCLVLFDGTAPSGTLTNGVTFYSASGEARVMDAAGNSTLLSPHDAETNEWIFYSKHTVTGKVLRVDMERLVKAMDAQLGGGFVHESVEA